MSALPRPCEASRRGIGLSVLLTASAWTLGCGWGGASPVAPPPPPPPPSITVQVIPASAAVLLGNTQTFTATVKNTTDTGVTWSVNGTAGGTASAGTITTGGIYTAPAILPQPASVEIRATSQADATKFATAQVSLTSDIAVGVAPGTASIELGAVQNFQASMASNGHPDPSLRWSVSCAAGSANCGSIDGNGSFTAPQVLPSPTSVSVTAQSVADPSRQATAAATITSNFTLSLSAPPNVTTASSATVTASLEVVPGSNPSTVLAWSLSGAGCSGSACGLLTPSPVQSTGGGITSATATYTAPPRPPTPDTITITVTPQADPLRKSQVVIQILPSSGVSVTLSPLTSTRAVTHRLTLSVQVNGTANQTVSWSVNSIAGGNATLGQICAAGSSPCQTLTTSSASQVDYLAPGAIPLPNPVTVLAVSQADPAAASSAQITVITHIQVTVQPANVSLPPGAVQAFTASVLGSSNQSVVWQVQGAACGAAGSPCGTVDANGFYAAPSNPPTPNAIRIVALSSEDSTQQGFANVSISTGANIQRLLPASVYAGGTAGFTLKVEGSGFAATIPGPGSSLQFAGTARTTTCSSANECTAPVQPGDVAARGNIAVQVRNPDGSISNQVVLVIAAPSNTEEVITLTAAIPSAGSKDIVAVEPTTAGVDVPGNSVDLDVAALGAFSLANNSCTLAGNPVVVVRPVSGAATAELCVFSFSGLDTSMSYSVSGSGDVAVIAKQPAGLGIIHLTLQVRSDAVTGTRTLFIQNSNLDKTAATGALEVQ